MCAGMMLLFLTSANFAAGGAAPLDRPAPARSAGQTWQECCPCLDTFCVSVCELVVRLLQSVGAAAPATGDRPLTDHEMRELLESTEFLESALEGLYFGPDEPLDESVLGSEETRPACPFHREKASVEPPMELTIAPAPRDLVLEEESQSVSSREMP
jgi:hypothetical protein